MVTQPQSAQWLERIVRSKQLELEHLRLILPQSTLEKQVQPRKRGAFRQALLATNEGQPCYAVIAELKKASPSRGVICAEYNPSAIARRYHQAGARAISVLTEREFFLGSLDHLREVKAATTLPVLRKDFILEDYHLYEAAAAGADAILLIVAVLQPATLQRLLRLSHTFGLDALVEVHTRDELQIALDSGSEIIGVNNRNLRTFEVSLATSFELIDPIPDHIIAISESGLRTPQDLQRLRAAGFDAFLIGEHLMTEKDPGEALHLLLSANTAKLPVTH